MKTKADLKVVKTLNDVALEMKEIANAGRAACSAAHDRGDADALEHDVELFRIVVLEQDAELFRIVADKLQQWWED